VIALLSRRGFNLTPLHLKGRELLTKGKEKRGPLLVLE
jgi:hypothetical protein